MRYDIIERYWESFSEKGFKRLVNEGANCKNAYYDYIITESAPGYATLATGNNPSGHGIISDSWYLRLNGREQFCVSDSRLADKPGLLSGNNFSPRQIIGSSLGDELRISNFKQSKVIAIANKPYAAVLSSGYLANAAYWTDSQTSDWTSSSYYMDALPKWVQEFNEKRFVSIYLSREWNTINQKNTYKESLADNNSYETGFSNKQKTFPYKLNDLSKTEGAKIINFTPFGNTYTIDFAIAAILNEKLGEDEFTDLLTISFATPGYVTELFGIRSIELQDIYIRLDSDIAHLLEFIDDKYGKDKVLVVLTSDRGATDNYEFMGDIGMPTGKFYPAQSISLLESYLKALYGLTNWVKHYRDRQIYLNELTIDACKAPIGEVEMKAAQFMAQFQAIATATTAHVLQTGSFISGDLLKFQNSYNMARSGDILLSLKPGYIEEFPGRTKENFVQTSPYRYNAHVPLLFYGWKIKQKVLNNSIPMTNVVPTLANFLNISFPSGTKGQFIDELLKE
jgi:predicted AlkP superfamily pyrophosphatase or phosphodiesterase